MSTPSTFQLKPVQVALIQLGCIGPDKMANLRHARSMVVEAKKSAPNGHVDMIMLPECFNSPYSVDQFPKYAESFSGIYEQIKQGGRTSTSRGSRSWPVDNLNNERPLTLTSDFFQKSPTLEMLCNVAKETGTVLVGGSVPEWDEKTGRLYNTSCVLDAQGRLISLHRKLHLFDIDIPGKMTFQESLTLTAGDRLTIFDCGMYTGSILAFLAPLCSYTYRSG